jgi:hypothetical protein
MEIKNMKKILFTILILCNFYSFGQNEMESEINELFFKINLNQSPKEIIKQSELKFVLNPNKTIGNTINYSAKFSENENIKSDQKSVTLKLDYDEIGLEYGYYEISQVVTFKNVDDLNSEYTRLTEKFEKYSVKTIIENTENLNSEITNKNTEFRILKDFEIPSLSFGYINREKNKYVLIIVYKTSFKLEKMIEFLKNKRK